MPYQASDLTNFYTALTGVAPDAATSLAFQAYANQNNGGTLSDAQTLANVFNSVGVQATFEVAESTYQFFTGATTSQGGLNFLEGRTGSGNTTGLTNAYYNGTNGSITAPGTGGFNVENRYYNFAINLATAGGAGNANFTATYGGLTFAQTVSAAYENIVGSANVGTANANAAIADIISRQGFFQQIAATRGGDATANSSPNTSLVLKAVVVGYILEEANKADIGTYAKAIDQFEASVAAGNAIFATNALTTYQAGGAGFNTGVGLTSSSGTLGQTIALTPGTDTLNTTAGNVTFIAQVGGQNAGVGGSSPTLGPSDTINAQGANNTIIINTANGPQGDASGGALLNGIQTVDIRVTDGVGNGGAGTATLNQSVVANATAINSYLSSGLVTVNNVAGGTTVGIVGNGSVQGGSLTANFVSGTTANVALTGGVQSAAQVGGGAATNLTIAPAAAGNTVNLTSSGTVNSVDTLDVSNNFGLTITANQAFNTNVITDAALRTLNVSGSGAVNLGTTAVAVRTVTSTDTGGLTASFTTPAAATSALNITTAAGAADRITITNAFANTVINTGGGGDTIQVSGTIAAGASLNGAGGATLAVTTADYTGVSAFSAANRALITGFSTLGIIDAGGVTNGTTYDVNLIGAQNFTSTGAAAGNTATVNAASGAIITQTGSANFGGTIIVNEANATMAASTNDSITLGFAQQTASGTANIQIAGVETAQVIANRAVGVAAATTLTLNLTEQAAATPALKTLTFAGNESFVFMATAAETALTSITSSTTQPVNINVLAISNFAGAASNGTAAAPLTVTTGAGADNISVKDFDRITAGAGADTINITSPSTGQTYSSLTDGAAGDRLNFVTNAFTSAATTFTPITLASTASFQDYLDAATQGTAAAGPINYFNFGGNTYVVADNSTATTYQNGVDSVIQLVGTHTIAAINNGFVTLGS